jgi:hypothetical protein
MQWLGETLFHQGLLSHYEACAAETLNNALSTLVDWGVVVRRQALASAVARPLGQGVQSPGMRRAVEAAVPCVALAAAYRGQGRSSALSRLGSQYAMPNHWARVLPPYTGSGKKRQTRIELKCRSLHICPLLSDKVSIGQRAAAPTAPIDWAAAMFLGSSDFPPSQNTGDTLESRTLLI